MPCPPPFRQIRPRLRLRLRLGLAAAATALICADGWAATPKAPFIKPSASQSTDPVPAAAPQKQAQRWNLYAGLGLYTAAIAKYTSTSDASTSTFSKSDYPLAVGLSVKMSETLRLMPTLYWSVLYPRRLPEGQGSAETILLRLPAARQVFNEAFEVVGGIAYHETRIYGTGGIVQLNNGTSTSGFAAPAESRSSRSLAFDVGVQKEWRRFLLGLDFTAEALLNNQRRTFGVLVTGEYQIWGF